MNFQETRDTVLSELQNVFENIDPAQVERLA